MPEHKPQEKEDSFYDLFVPLTNKKAIIFICIIGFVVFFNSFFNPFQGDDSAQVINNPYIRHISSIPIFFYHSMGFSGIDGNKFLHTFYRPLLFTTYTLVYPIMGGSPIPFHILQLLLHISITILVFLIFSKFIKRNLAFVFSLFFLIHPLNSEAVIYIADMQDVLFVLFGLCAFLGIMVKKHSLLPYSRLILVSVLLLLSFLSKETGILFTFVLVLYTLLFERQNVKRITATMVLTIIIYIVLRYIASFAALMDVSPYPIQGADLLIRLITIPKIISYYLSTFVMPIHLAIGQAWFVKQIDFPDFYRPLIIDLLFFSSVINGGIILYRKRNSFFNSYLFFTIWFCLGLCVHLQIIPLDATVADRWFYFPIIGLLGMIGIFLKAFYQQVIAVRFMMRSFLTLGCLILLVFSIMTIQRNSQWQSRFILYSHDIQYAGDSPMLDTNYGGLLMLNGQFDAAKPYLEQSVALDPKLGGNLNNLAVWYEHKKNYKKAKSLYEENIQLNQRLPRFLAVSYGGLARIALLHENNPREAKRLSELALKQTPLDTQGLEFLALSEYKLGEKKEALLIFQELYSYVPDPASRLYYFISNNKQFVLDPLFGATIVY